MEAALARYNLRPLGRFVAYSVAGVPPDAFNPNGQHWGNPLYRWNTLAKSDYRFWVQRLGAALERFDAVRLDHFIGFHRYWEIAASGSAKDGRFVYVANQDDVNAFELYLSYLTPPLRTAR